MPNRATERRPAPREPLAARVPYAAAALALAVGLWVLGRLGALPLPRAVPPTPTSPAAPSAAPPAVAEGAP